MIARKNHYTHARGE